MRLSGRRLTATLVALLVITIAAGSVAAYAIGRQQSENAAAPTNPRTTSQTSPSAGSSSSIPVATSAGSPPSAPATRSGPTSRSVATRPPVDAQVVLGAQSADHPRAGEIQELVERYFQAINDKDFDAWAATVSADQLHGYTVEQWLGTYRTTTDSNIEIVQILDDPLQVQMTFVSEQDPADAPPAMQVDCILWDVTYYLGNADDGSLVVGLSQRELSQMKECP